MREPSWPGWRTFLMRRLLFGIVVANILAWTQISYLLVVPH